MFHKTNRSDFAAVLDVNVLGLMDLARAASVHLRAQGHGRIVLIASTAGLHGEPTVSAYAASKGAVLALGRTIAVEGAPRGVLTNMVLPYATTPMTEANMDPDYRDTMAADAVAPVVSALVHPDSTLNGQVVITANGSLRAASSIEWGTVPIPQDVPLSPEALASVAANQPRGHGTRVPHRSARVRGLRPGDARLNATTIADTSPDRRPWPRGDPQRAGRPMVRRRRRVHVSPTPASRRGPRRPAAGAGSRHGYLTGEEGSPCPEGRRREGGARRSSSRPPGNQLRPARCARVPRPPARRPRMTARRSCAAAP